MYDLPLIAQAVVSGLTLGFLFALAAVGLTLIYGMMDLVNFAHGELVVIGMYTAFWLWKLWDVDPLFSLPVVALVVALIGALIYRLLIRRMLDAALAAQMFMTFGLSIFLIGSMQFIWTPFHRLVTSSLLVGRIEFLGIFMGRTQVAAGVIALIAFGLLYLLLRKTELGRALLATSQDRQAAALMGIDTDRMYMVAWALAGASAGVAGALLSNIFSTYPNAGIFWALTAYVAVVLGGFGSVRGALVGALVVGLIQIGTSIFINPQFKLIAVYSIFIVVLILRPSGLFGAR